MIRHRWRWAGGCFVLGLVVVLAGWLIPAHLRAVDRSVLEQAGRGSSTLASRGLALASQGNYGAAELLLKAAPAGQISDSIALSQADAKLRADNPGIVAWGGAASSRLEAVFKGDSTLSPDRSEPVTSFLLRGNNRNKVLEILQSSSLPVMRVLLNTRRLTNTVIFPPSSSAAGQAFDVSLAICGLLLDQGRLSASLTESIQTLASAAEKGESTQPLEESLLDWMSLGKRLDWGQLVAFAQPMEDTTTLHRVAVLARDAGEQFPILYSAVVLSGKPTAVCNYLEQFGGSGFADLQAGLRYGPGGMEELLRRDVPLYDSAARQRLAAQPAVGRYFHTASVWAWRLPELTLALKWFLYFTGGFYLAAAAHFARRLPVAERPLEVGGIHVAREALFALGFLLVVLLWSEPFLARGSQNLEHPIRLRLPTAGSVVPGGIAGVKPILMNPINLLTLVLFFVLQALIYVACLVKLAEIRRTNISPRIKLKLLENEDHLFDSGLYLGFVGTIISLILVSLGVIKPSLMAAYSSTSFGIIFVSMFKIFNLRPARRQLLLAAENQAEIDAAVAESVETISAHPYPAHS